MRIVILLAALLVGIVIGIGIGTTINRDNPSPTFERSDSTTMSLYEAKVWLEGGIYSHQYYLDHPEYQNKGTGDSDFQIKTIKQYNRAKSLIEKMMR